jgi:hypothetical protein
MKTIQFLTFGLLMGGRLFSQDTLYTTEGNIIAGKVMEITNEDIKYKKSSNLDGPVYIISKADVVVIDYKNGSKDVFAKSGTTTGANNTSQAYNNNSAYPQQVYVAPRPAINVVVGASPFYGYNPWNYNRGWGYRPNVYYRGGGYGGYHGGYGGHHGGGYGHHR